MDDEALREKIIDVARWHSITDKGDREWFADQVLLLIKQDRATQDKARKDVVNRFEVVNHLPAGNGREIVIWNKEPFDVTYSLQDEGRTLKVFLSGTKTKAPTNKKGLSLSTGNKEETC